MHLDQKSIDECKEYILDVLNDKVYESLKDYVNVNTFTSEEYTEALDYFIDSLDGYSIEWIEST